MDAPETYQGERLGLPREGVGSIASFLRRLVALLVDWLLCQLIATTFWDIRWGEVSGAEAFITLGLFFVVNVVLVTTIGTTVGHRLMGVRVVATDAVAQGHATAAPPPGRSVIRAALLCLFIPAVIMDGDGRGLHDKAARTVVVQGR